LIFKELRTSLIYWTYFRRKENESTAMEGNEFPVSLRHLAIFGAFTPPKRQINNASSVRGSMKAVK
jgi:hypothetical protein